MSDYGMIRDQIRLLVDPLLIRLRQELYGSGATFANTLTQTILPPATVVTGGNGGTDITTLGYIKGIAVYSGGTLVGTNKKELNFLGAGVTVAGDRATIDYATPLAGKISNPMTTAGDIIYGTTGGAPVRLGIGSTSYILMVSGGLPTWQPATAVGGFVSPMTTLGDIIYAESGGAAYRLGVGSTGQALIVSGNRPTWQTIPSGFTNPMTTTGDIIYAISGGSPTRLGIGSVSQILQVLNGTPQWVNYTPGLTNPMTSGGDIIYGVYGTATNIALNSNGIAHATNGGYFGNSGQQHDGNDSTFGFSNTTASAGSWFSCDLTTTHTITQWRVSQRTDSPNYQATNITLQLSNDNSTWEDVATLTGQTTDSGIVPLSTARTARYWRILATAGGIFGWCVRTFALYEGIPSGNPERLPIGISGQVLTIVSGLPSWQTPVTVSGFTNPMTTAGDLIYGTTGGTALRLPIGTSGQVLTVSGGLPTWQTISASGLSGTTAPADADYWVETANSTLSGEVVVGTTGITTAAYASRQAAAKAGRLFLPNNGFYIERDTGSAWASWGPIFPMTPPISGDFAWINQGSATISTTNGGIYISQPSGAELVHIQKKTKPSTTFTITAAFVGTVPLTGSNFAGFGLTFRQSSDGKIHNFGVRNNNGVWSMNSFKWTDATTFSASYSESTMIIPNIIWFRIADDGSNRICSFSADGINFQQFHSIGRTDFLTADEVGFFINPNNNNIAMGMTLLSWKET